MNDISLLYSPSMKGYKPFLSNNINSYNTTPTRVKTNRSELAIRLNGIITDAHQHEVDKSKIKEDFSHEKLIMDDVEYNKTSMNVHIGGWRPFDEKIHMATATTSLPLQRHIRANSLIYEPVKVRPYHCAERTSLIMNGMPYQCLAITFTILSLYLYDLDYAVMPMAADLPCSIILCVIMSLFAIELGVSCAMKKNYIFSFYFWLDLIGTLSLLVDISFIANSLFPSVPSNIDTDGRVQQSASVVRLTRFARILRVIRLIRIVRLFRYRSPTGGNRHPSKVGLHLSELMDKRVILMVIGMAIIVPFLTADPSWTDQSNALGLEFCVDSTTTADLLLVQNQVISTHPNLLYLYLDTSVAPDTILVDLLSSNTELRQEELESYSIGNSQAIYSIRDYIYLTAVYSMATTTLVIAVFFVGSVLISRNVHTLIVGPLERMTSIIRKLAGTVCFLTANNEQEAAQITNGLETSVIENAIEKMAEIFAVQPNGNSALPKPLQMMAGSKHTEIVTNSSVISIEVVERPKDVKDLLIDDDCVSDERSSWLSAAQIGEHKECSSVESILCHPSIIPYFHHYLATCIVAENLMFCLEVERFRSIAKLHALNLYNSFISSRAHNQINLDANQKADILEKMENPSADLFDAAQKECLNLMRAHWNIFLSSKYCRRYLRKRDEMEKKKTRARVLAIKSSQERQQHQTNGKEEIGSMKSVVMPRGSVISKLATSLSDDDQQKQDAEQLLHKHLSPKPCEKRQQERAILQQLLPPTIASDNDELLSSAHCTRSVKKGSSISSKESHDIETTDYPGSVP